MDRLPSNRDALPKTPGTADSDAAAPGWSPRSILRDQPRVSQRPRRGPAARGGEGRRGSRGWNGDAPRQPQFDGVSRRVEGVEHGPEGSGAGIAVPADERERKRLSSEGGDAQVGSVGETGGETRPGIVKTDQERNVGQGVLDASRQGDDDRRGASGVAGRIDTTRLDVQTGVDQDGSRGRAGEKQRAEPSGGHVVDQDLLLAVDRYRPDEAGEVEDAAGAGRQSHPQLAGRRERVEHAVDGRELREGVVAPARQSTPGIVGGDAHATEGEVCAAVATVGIRQRRPTGETGVPRGEGVGTAFDPDAFGGCSRRSDDAPAGLGVADVGSVAGHAGIVAAGDHGDGQQRDGAVHAQWAVVLPHLVFGKWKQGKVELVDAVGLAVVLGHLDQLLAEARQTLADHGVGLLRDAEHDAGQIASSCGSAFEGRRGEPETAAMELTTPAGRAISGGVAIDLSVAYQSPSPRFSIRPHFSRRPIERRTEDLERRGRRRFPRASQSPESGRISIRERMARCCQLEMICRWMPVSRRGALPLRERVSACWTLLQATSRSRSRLAWLYSTRGDEVALLAGLQVERLGEALGAFDAEAALALHDAEQIVARLEARALREDTVGIPPVHGFAGLERVGQPGTVVCILPDAGKYGGCWSCPSVVSWLGRRSLPDGGWRWQLHEVLLSISWS